MSEEEKDTLATELLSEVKHSAFRWFVIAVVELAVLFIVILLCILVPYESSEETSYSQAVEDITDSSEISQRIGDDYGESDANGY